MAAILSVLKPITRAISSIEIACLAFSHALSEDCARSLFFDELSGVDANALLIYVFECKPPVFEPIDKFFCSAAWLVAERDCVQAKSQRMANGN